MSLGDLIRREGRRTRAARLVLIGEPDGLIGHLDEIAAVRDEARRSVRWTPGTVSAPAVARAVGHVESSGLLDVVVAAAPSDWGPLELEGSHALLDEMHRVGSAVVQQQAAGSDTRVWLCIELGSPSPDLLAIWHDLHAGLLQRPRSDGAPAVSLVLIGDAAEAAHRIRALLDDEHRFGSAVHDLSGAGHDPTPFRGIARPETARVADAVDPAMYDATRDLARPALSPLDDLDGLDIGPHESAGAPATGAPAATTDAEMLTDAIGYIASRSALEQVTAELRSARDQLTQTEAELREHRAEVDRLSERRAQLENEVRALDDRVTLSRQTIDEDIAAASAALRDLDDQQRRARSELDAITNELERHGEPDDQRHLRALRASREHLVGELTRLSAARETQQHEADRLRSELERVLAETKQAEIRRAALHDESLHLETELERNRPFLLDAVEQLDAAQAEVDALRFQRDDLWDQLAALRHGLAAEHRAFVDHIERQRSAFEAEIDAHRRYLVDTGRLIGAQRRALAWRLSTLEHEIHRRADAKLSEIAGMSRRERRRLRRLGRRTGR